MVLGGEICWTAPTLHRGRVYVRNHTRAVCLFLGKPSMLDRQTTETMAVADIPQGEFHGLAATLGIEREYITDAPTIRTLGKWYFTSVRLIALAVVPACLLWTARSAREETWRLLRAAIWFVVFLLGAAAVTPLSIWRGELVFTWPLCLFVGLVAVV